MNGFDRSLLCKDGQIRLSTKLAADQIIHELESVFDLRVGASVEDKVTDAFKDLLLELTPLNLDLV